MNEKEKKLLLELENPDKDSMDHYKWDEEFQRHILGMLISDKNFLVQSFDLIKPEYFHNEPHRLICKLLFKHFNEYKVLPNKIHLRQELKTILGERDANVVAYYLTEFETVYNYYVPGVDDRDYLLDKVTNFAKMQALKSAFSRSLDEIKKDAENDDTWTKIHSILKEAMTVDRNFEIGLDYFQTFEDRYTRMEQALRDGEYFTSGFDAIDDALNGGLLRGEIASWMGLSGSGKSLMLTTAAIANIHLGKKVLYISLEIDQDRTASRFDAQFVDPSGKLNIGINDLSDKKEVLFEALKDYLKDKIDNRLLIIKQFPGGTFDVNTLRAYYTQVGLYGFKPDLVIIDYVGEMKDHPGMPTHESRFRIVRDLRGWGVEEKVCVFVAMQPAEATAKEQQKVGEIDEANLGDSKAQIRPLDACWSINQTQIEKDCNIARIFVVKHRFGKTKFKFFVEFNPKTLKYSEITHEKYDRIRKTYSNEMKEKASESDLMASVENIIGGGNTNALKDFAKKVSENIDGD